MSITTYALHKIHNEQELSFNAKDYSKFKFGDGNISKKFGKDLAKGMIKQPFFKKLVKLNKQFVVCASPYQFVPTATTSMTKAFIEVLNYYLVSKNYNPIQEQKIHRSSIYKEDYGALSAEERINLIDSDNFHIDKEFVNGKIIIFMDDVKITGSHEELIRRMINYSQLSNDIVLSYFASLENKEINPNFENKINYASVKELKDLSKIIKSDNFIINTRVIKFILNSSESEFSTFINYQSEDFVRTLFHQAVGNGYGSIPDYKKNLEYIKSTI